MTPETADTPLGVSGSEASDLWTHYIAFNISYPSKWGCGSRPRETAGEDMEQDIF